MVLGALGDRRSMRTRAVAGAAMLATFLGPLYGVGGGGWARAGAPSPAVAGTLPDDSARRSSDLVRPVMVADVAGKVSADVLWRLFDGDARTGLVAAEPVKIRLTFASAIAVDAVGAYGPAAGVLSVRGVEGAGAGAPSSASDPSIDLAAAGQPWRRLTVKDVRAARSLVVEWAPGRADALLPELEIWGRGSGSAATSSGTALEEALHAGVPDGAESYTADAASAGARSISAATPAATRTFSVSLPMHPASIERAFLAYDLADLPHFTAAVRSINGGPAIGGFGVSLGAEGGPAVEEISPATLRRGANTIRFDPASPTNPIGYRVDHVRLVVTHASSARATADAPGLDDGKESTGWEGGDAGSARRWRFAGPAQPRELELRLAKGHGGRQEGALVVMAGNASGTDRAQVKIDLGGLAPGWHKVALDALPPVETLTLALAGGTEGAPLISELMVTGSPLPAPTAPRLRVTYPLHGECVNHEVHVRGLATPAPGELRANGAPVRGARFEPGGFSFAASEKALGGGAGKPFRFTVESVDHAAGGARARAEVAVSGCVDRPPVVAGRLGGRAAGPAEDAGAPYGVVVAPERAATLEFAGAKLEVPAGAVKERVRLTIRPLEPGRVPVLDAGMTNVTAGGRAFRLGPRGMKFEKPVALSLPVDRARVDPDEDARAFYFDEAERGWREVTVRAAARGELTAETTHFTDFIAATLKLPEHPGVQSLNPTSLKEIKVADPAAGVPLIAPPTPSSKGTANLSHPIEVPPGRRGMQPGLAITYDSDGGNGWLGVGWNLAIPTIEIDTSFGVPKYDIEGKDSYLLNGEALTPATSAPAGAPPGKYFWRRREGRFDWIQRVEQSSGVFHWVVTDKAGLKYTYGQNNAARLMRFDGTNFDSRKTFKWFLEKVEDLYGNQIRYTYDNTTDRGVLPAVPPNASGEPFIQVYPKEIFYTEFRGATANAPYRVRFNLTTANRPDAFSSGRGGFQVLTRRLLDSVDVMNGTAVVRRYKLAYVGGDFGKSVLRTLQVFGKGPTTTPIAEHSFDYHQVPRDVSGNLQLFGSPVFPYATAVQPTGVLMTGSTLSDSLTESSAMSISVGVPYANIGTGINTSRTTGARWMEDLDGDGLADFSPYNEVDGNRQSIAVQADNSVLASLASFNYPNLKAPHTTETTKYLNASFSLGPITHGEDYGNITEGHSVVIDINGDGLPDKVKSQNDDTLLVSLNRGRGLGFEVGVPWTGYRKTGLEFDCGDVFFSSSNAAASSAGTATFSSPQASFPSVDIVTAWVAPYAGDIAITGNVQRPANEVGGDGVVASIYLGSSLLWEREFGPQDTAPCTPAGPGLPEPGSTCGPTNGAIWKTVAAGDRVFTRVNAKANAEHDVLDWDLTVKYRSTPTFEEDNAREAWGPKRYVWSEKNDQRVIGQFYTPWRAVARGTVNLEARVTKQQTSDKVRLIAQLVRGGSPVSTPILNREYLANETHTNQPLGPFGNFQVFPGDEIHIYATSDLPIDPDRMRVLSLVNYASYCRYNPYLGGEYCGTPTCQPVQGEQGALPATDCAIVPPGATSDPVPSRVPGSNIHQVVPTYHPLPKWWVQRRPGDNPQTIDGRSTLLAPAANLTLRLCYQSADPGNAGMTMKLAIQSWNELLTKLDVNGDTGENGVCASVPNAAVALNDPIYLSVYAPRPLSGAYNLTGFYRLPGTTTDVPVPISQVNIYYSDVAPSLAHFPWIGRAEDMSAGFHGLFTGSWNGNKPFDPALITAAGNDSYLPLFAAPVPKDALAAGHLAFFDDLVDFLSDALGYLSSFATYLWDDAVGAAKLVGSNVIKGVRVLGSVALDIMAWGLCELSGFSYTAKGVRYSESHNQQLGIGLGSGVGVSDGVTLSGLDLVDMNGDRYPDQVSTVGVRYSFYDPATRTGQFCGDPKQPPSALNCPGSNVVSIPGLKKQLRDVRHAMYSATVGTGTPDADSQSTDPEAKATGVAPEAAGAVRVSQGYSHMGRDLRDVNGDGLPDLVEASGYGLTVRLNYGYGFSVPIAWSSPDWSVPQPAVDSVWANILDDIVLAISQFVLSQAPPTSATLRLEEEGHKGASVALVVGGGAGSAGWGLDQTYTRTLVDLLDVNGDGLPDQVMKLPGQPFRVKVNRGTSFGTEISVPADPWPNITVAFAAFEHVGAQAVDTLGFSRTDASDSGVTVLGLSSQNGVGGASTAMQLLDIDGDGKLDHVMKSGDPIPFTSSSNNANVYARLNQTGKSNLLAKVTRPFGGTIELDYKRFGNVSATRTGIDGVVGEYEMPEARWVLSRVTVTDGRGNRYTDMMDIRVAVEGAPFTAAGFYDRNEREFYGYSRLWLRHGIPDGSGGFIEGDGSVEYRYFLNQSYHEAGLPLAEYTFDTDNMVLRGSVIKHFLSPTPDTATPSSKFVQATTALDLVYERTIPDLDIFFSDPAEVFNMSEPIPNAPVWRRTDKGFDMHGNLVSVVERGDSSTSADDIAYALRYAPFSGQRFMALDQITATPPGDSTTILARRQATWVLQNNRPVMTRMTDFIHGGEQPGTGTLYNGQESITSFTYDDAVGDFGNLRTVTAPSGHVLTLTFDTTTRTYPTRVEDNFGLFSTSTINYDFGAPASTTDANGEAVNYGYDNFGRASKVWGPTDPISVQPTIEMVYSQASGTAAEVPWARTRHKDFQSSTSDTIDTVAFIDGLGRTIQIKKEAEVLQPNGTTLTGYSVSGLRVFDARGRVLAQHQPFFDSATPLTSMAPAPQRNPTVYSYDGLGRTRFVTLPDGNFRITQHFIVQPNDPIDGGVPGATAPLAAKMTSDERGRVRRTYADGTGSVVAAKDVHVTSGGSTEVMITRYEYDRFGRITKVKDPTGNDAAVARYDSLGRMFSMWMPDAGATTYRYDLAGRLAEKRLPGPPFTPPTIRYTYDRDRLTAVDYPDTTADVGYTYGVVGDTGDVTANRLGRIKTVTMEAGTELRSYDVFGNISQTVTTLQPVEAPGQPSPAVTMLFNYDWLGRMRTMTFPRVVLTSGTVPTGAGEVITYTYDKGGMLDRITGKPTSTSPTENYVNDIGYDEFGARTRLVSGNTITNNYGYHPQRRFLTSVNATANPSSGALQFHALTYQHDAVGNITKVINSPPHSALRTSAVGVGPLELDYWYDDLDRLQGSNGKYRGHTTYGFEYSASFEYDIHHNLKQKGQGSYRNRFNPSDVGLSNPQFDGVVAPTSYNLSYTYRPGHVHAAETIVETDAAGTVRPHDYTFDQRGNLTSEAYSGSTRTLTWDAENRLKQVTTNGVTTARFRYGAAGERTQKRESGPNTTFYFNQFLVIHANRTMTKHLFAGDTRVASKTEAFGATPVRHFYHPDHLGSTSYITNGAQTLVQHERYFPFGERWTSAPEEQVVGSPVRDWLFTSKELDRSTGLYYFGARYIDPRTSQWMSPDPIIGQYMQGRENGGFFKQENLGIYSYGWNNPVRFRDPDGRLGFAAIFGLGAAAAGLYKLYRWLDEKFGAPVRMGKAIHDLAETSNQRAEAQEGLIKSIYDELDGVEVDSGKQDEFARGTDEATARLPKKAAKIAEEAEDTPGLIYSLPPGLPDPVDEGLDDLKKGLGKARNLFNKRPARPKDMPDFEDFQNVPKF
jgi:RHS repeat-associated protein